VHNAVWGQMRQTSTAREVFILRQRTGVTVSMWALWLRIAVTFDE